MNLSEAPSEIRSVLYIKTHGETGSTQHIKWLRGWDVKTVDGISDARQSIRQHNYNVGLIHLEQSDNEYLRATESLLSEHSAMEWVLLTNNECLKQRKFCKLIHQGCYDYYTLPLNSAAVNSLQSTIGHAYGMASLRVADVFPDHDEYEMVGASPQMMKLFSNVRKVSVVDAPVLISGESGTGKELIAQAIHERSSRAEKPFIAVNCGAIPENLIHSELFGHEKGAFTGAHKQKIGQIEAANGGTLFLDEIGDLPLELQVNLLRFLQEQVIQRVGSNSEIPVDVRVLAATHVDLDAAVQSNHFREDLLYRLNVLQINTPALREREGDIELMARFFFNRFRSDGNSRLKGFSNAALSALEQYGWPGNVRELINRVRRAIVMSEGRLITPVDLGLRTTQEPRSDLVISLEEARQRAERDAILSALRFCRSNMTKAAKVLGVSRVTLYRLMDKYQLEHS